MTAYELVSMLLESRADIDNKKTISRIDQVIEHIRSNLHPGEEIDNLDSSIKASCLMLVRA